MAAGGASPDNSRGTRVAAFGGETGCAYRLRRFLEGCGLPQEEAHVYWNGGFSRAAKEALARPLPAALSPIPAVLAGQGASLAPWLRFDQKYSLPDSILAMLDRVSMAHSLEVRLPTSITAS